MTPSSSNQRNKQDVAHAAPGPNSAEPVTPSAASFDRERSTPAYFCALPRIIDTFVPLQSAFKRAIVTSGKLSNPVVAYETDEPLPTMRDERGSRQPLTRPALHVRGAFKNCKFSNRHILALELGVSRSKQRPIPFSNRHTFTVCASRGNFRDAVCGSQTNLRVMPDTARYLPAPLSRLTARHVNSSGRSGRGGEGP
jgi:hypothetical protein